MKKKSIYNFIIMLLLLVVCAVSSVYELLPDNVHTKNLDSFLQSKIIKYEKVNAEETDHNNLYDAKLLGVLSLKQVNINSIGNVELYPGGTPVGIKLKTKGALVVALTDINDNTVVKKSPAATAGIVVGDCILEIDGKKISVATDISKIINEKPKRVHRILIERRGNKDLKNIKPIKSESDGKYKIGMWVRDSTAGVGTLTFYHDGSKKFGALGHPITDVDTGEIMKIENGEIVNSNILSVKKGMRGAPGELRGIFNENSESLGKIKSNTICGIFGESNEKMINPISSKPLPIALKDEIEVGKAQIITTIKGKNPAFYDIQIEKLLDQNTANGKSMLIRVTDEKLLKETGGIVQGMSGSPIIQNNKIVGAVTHVLVNKPDVGYGIYIEWMINDAEILKK